MLAYTLNLIRSLLFQSGVEQNPGPPKRDSRKEKEKEGQPSSSSGAPKAEKSRSRSPGPKQYTRSEKKNLGVAQALSDMQQKLQGFIDAQQELKKDKEECDEEFRQQLEEFQRELTGSAEVHFDVGQCCNLSYVWSVPNFLRWMWGLQYNLDAPAIQEVPIIDRNVFAFAAADFLTQNRIVPEYRVFIHTYRLLNGHNPHEHLKRDDITALDVVATVDIIHFARDVTEAQKHLDVRYWRQHPWFGPLPADPGTLYHKMVMKVGHPGPKVYHTSFSVSLPVLAELLSEKVCVPHCAPTDVYKIAAAKLSQLGHVEYDRNRYLSDDWRPRSLQVVSLYHCHNQEKHHFWIGRAPAPASTSTATASVRFASPTSLSLARAVVSSDSTTVTLLIFQLLSALGLLYYLLALLDQICLMVALLWLGQPIGFFAPFQILLNPVYGVLGVLSVVGFAKTWFLPRVQKSLRPKIGYILDLTPTVANKSF